MALCTSLTPVLALLSRCLMGNFPCTGLNACNAVHDFNFFLLPRSLGVHPEGVCVCDFFYAFMCVDLSAFEFECVYLHVLRDL